MKIITVEEYLYAIEVDEHNVIIVNTLAKKRTTPVWKVRMFDFGFREELKVPEGPHPSIEELLAYPLYEAFEDPKHAEIFSYNERCKKYEE